MSRLTRMIVPVSLSALFTGAAIVACGGHHSTPGDMPASPRPEPVDPSGQPASAGGGPPPVSGAIPDAGTDGRTDAAPGLAPVSMEIRGPGASRGVPLILAAQPTLPTTAGQPGAPSTGAPTTPSPTTPSPSPTTPGSPTTGAPPTGSPSPATPTPGSPSPNTPTPGSPSPNPPTPGTPSPGTPSTPGDAGVDGGSSGPTYDAPLRNDAAMQPILRRGSAGQAM
jgi:hypothetical protein